MLGNGSLRALQQQVIQADHVAFQRLQVGAGDGDAELALALFELEGAEFEGGRQNHFRVVEIHGLTGVDAVDRELRDAVVGRLEAVREHLIGAGGLDVEPEQ